MGLGGIGCEPLGFLGRIAWIKASLAWEKGFLDAGGELVLLSHGFRAGGWAVLGTRICRDTILELTPLNPFPKPKHPRTQNKGLKLTL